MRLRAVTVPIALVLLSYMQFCTARPTFDKIAEVLLDLVDTQEYQSYPHQRPPPGNYAYPPRPIYAQGPGNQEYQSHSHHRPPPQGNYEYPPRPIYAQGPGNQYPNGYDGYYQQRPPNYVYPNNAYRPEYYPPNGPGYGPGAAGYGNYGYRNPAAGY